jgi:acetyl esterase
MARAKKYQPFQPLTEPMKPTIDFFRRLLVALASCSVAYAADGPGPTPGSPVVGEDAIKGAEISEGAVPIPADPDKKPDEDQAKTDAKPRAQASPQMQAVLDELTAMGGKPITELSPADARKQPSPADAVARLMKKQGKEPDKLGKIDDIDIELATGSVDGRVYKPEGDGPFPVILYIHGGGWVLADLDTYDATPRSLAKATGALVISTDYRHAPEHKFPAAHEDVFGAYQWTLQNAGRWGGDAKRVAVVGESAGANMALALSMMAQDKGMQMPVHEVLVYPVATTGTTSESYAQHAQAAPLNAAMMKWFFEQTLANKDDWTDHQINVLEAKTLKGMPPTTIITADIDPLRSDGEMLAKKLEADGVPVAYKNYEGVTHEFFGMGAVVDTAREAVDFAADNLKNAFAGEKDRTYATPPLKERE